MVNPLEPSWISEGDDETEALTVEVWAKGFPIRLLCGYGPQENDSKETKTMFWDYIEQEIQNASKNGAGMIIQIDGNLWAGNKIVKNDPNTQNQNGRLFEDFLKRNRNITALLICKSKITRARNTSNGTQESILDFFLVCEQILPLVTKMEIFENGENALTRYRGGKVVRSDHNMLHCEINLTFHDQKKHEQVKMFNLTNQECQAKFKNYTSNTNIFSKCFESDESINLQFNRWKRKLVKSLYACFRKIRINHNKEKEESKIDILMKQQNSIMKI